MQSATRQIPISIRVETNSSELDLILQQQQILYHIDNSQKNKYVRVEHECADPNVEVKYVFVDNRDTAVSQDMDALSSQFSTASLNVAKREKDADAAH